MVTPRVHKRGATGPLRYAEHPVCRQGGSAWRRMTDDWRAVTCKRCRAVRRKRAVKRLIHFWKRREQR